MPSSSTDHHQHRPDVLRGPPGSGRAERSHRRLPDGAEVVAHERLLGQSRRLLLLQQEGGIWQRRLRQRGVTSASCRRRKLPQARPLRPQSFSESRELSRADSALPRGTTLKRSL